MLGPGRRESTFLGGEQRERGGGGVQACRNQWCPWLLPHLYLLLWKAEWIPEQWGGQTDWTWSLVPLKASNIVVPAHGRLALSFFFFLCYFFRTEVWLIYRVILVSGVSAQWLGYISICIYSDSDSKEFACSSGDQGLIPRLGRSPGEGNDYPLQYSCLENPMAKGNSWATVHGFAKSWTQLSDFYSLSLYIYIPLRILFPCRLLQNIKYKHCLCPGR